MHKTSLRIGVIASNLPATEGGASTLLESLVQVLETMESHHVFIRFTAERGVNAHGHLRDLRAKVRATRFGDSLARGVRTVRPSDPQGQRQAQLNQWIRTQQIDVVWFL